MNINQPTHYVSVFFSRGRRLLFTTPPDHRGPELKLTQSLRDVTQQHTPVQKQYIF